VSFQWMNCGRRLLVFAGWRGWRLLVLVVLVAWAEPAWGEEPGPGKEGAGGGEGVVEPEWEDELAPALDSNRQPLGPDPLSWPQWLPGERAAFEAGRPVNLGGGLWPAERHPLEPSPRWEDGRSALEGADGRWCVDAGRLMDEASRQRLETHLAVYAQTAVHPVRVWLVGSAQSTVEAGEEGAWHHQSFGGAGAGVLAILNPEVPLAARLILPGWLSARQADWGASVMSRVDAAAPAAVQLEQLVLWLTLQAPSLPGPSVEKEVATTVELRGRPAGGGGRWFGWGHRQWWAVGGVAVTVGFLSVWLWRRRRIRG